MRSTPSSDRFDAAQTGGVHAVPYIPGQAASPGSDGEPDASHPPAASAVQEDSPSVPQLKTYIVEDSQVIRENLIATLEELVPVEVVGTAEDESTAVQWLGLPSNHADLLIIDIFLKAGSGLGVLRAARALPLPLRGHVVVLSNYATPDMRRKCLELGADQVFDKSNEIDALMLYCSRLAGGEPGHSGHGALR